MISSKVFDIGQQYRSLLSLAVARVNRPTVRHLLDSRALSS